MNCENSFCIYQKGGECLLDEISLDNSGMCEDCIRPNIPEQILENEKEKLRERFEAEN